MKWTEYYRRMEKWREVKRSQQRRINMPKWRICEKCRQYERNQDFFGFFPRHLCSCDLDAEVVE